MNVATASAAAEAAGAILIALDDEHYPPLLREIHDPPPFLFARGDIALLQEPQLAVVGSRKASAAGLRVAQDLCAELTRAGLHVSSGLALGIDGAAHRGALAAGGKTIAVMATGIDTVYPQRHRALAAQVCQAGCLLTEFPPGTLPLRHHFPRRNRIISGLSLGVLVIEAALPSGSLITATSALEQGREVFALPWSALHTGGRGCLQLIRDGAKMVLEVEDILDELGPMYHLQQSHCETDAAEASAGTSLPESALLALVGFETVSLDELVLRSAQPVAQVLADLSDLELAGHVQRTTGGYMRC